MKQQEEDTANNKNNKGAPTDSLAIKQDQTDVNLVKKGTLETETYVLKKKPEKSELLNAVNVNSWNHLSRN